MQLDSAVASQNRIGSELHTVRTPSPINSRFEESLGRSSIEGNGMEVSGSTISMDNHTCLNVTGPTSPPTTNGAAHDVQAFHQVPCV